jgi:hypothetical protein
MAFQSMRRRGCSASAVPAVMTGRGRGATAVRSSTVVVVVRASLNT